MIPKLRAVPGARPVQIGDHEAGNEASAEGNSTPVEAVPVYG
jgi:hypothetical protein